MIFELPFRSIFLVHWIVPTFMALRFDFAATIRRFSVLGLTSNMFVNKHSDLLALGFLTGVDVRGTLRLLYMTHYVVYTITPCA